MTLTNLIRILISGVVALFLLSAIPAGNKMPQDLAAVIEKKWPGSSASIYSRQSSAEDNTIIYKISLKGTTTGWAYTRRVFSCRTGGCDQQNKSLETASHEYFDYFAILDSQYSVLEIKVYNYAATHGEEICSKAWLRQFKGYNGCKPLQYGKDIDGISGATISGKAIVEDIESGIRMVKTK